MLNISVNTIKSCNQIFYNSRNRNLPIKCRRICLSYRNAVLILSLFTRKPTIPDKYEQVHQWGSKRIFPYRFYAQERALQGGMRGVSFGALLGLDDFRKDAFAAGLHAKLINKNIRMLKSAFLFRASGHILTTQDNNPKDVHEKQLLQVMIAYRLFMPLCWNYNFD